MPGSQRWPRRPRPRRSRSRPSRPIIVVHLDYDAMLADPTIEAVYIPLPNHLHVEWTLKALEAGKHVLTEKPIAMTAPEIDALIAARDRTGLFASEAYMIVHHPQWQRVRTLIDEGAIGRLRHVDAVFSFDLPDVGNIRNRPETGGGSIPDIGVYAYGSARFAARAEPVKPTSRIRREHGVDVWPRSPGRWPGRPVSSATARSPRPVCTRGRRSRSRARRD